MKEDFKFSFPVRVRYDEIDGQRVVFYGVYLTYFDVAFTEYMRHMGINYAEITASGTWDTAVVKTVIEYKAPAFFDEILCICVRVSKIGRKSFTVDFEVYKEETDVLVAKGQNIYVTYDAKTRQAIEVPLDIKKSFEEYECLKAV